MKKFKKVLALILITSMLSTLLCGVALAATSTTVGVSTVATTIDVTVTVSASITINPTTGVATTPTMSIVNNSKAPITASTAGLGVDATGYFTLVAASKYPDWSILNKTQSKDIAITMTLGTGWKAKVTDNLATGVVGTLSGTIAPAGTATVTMSSVSHGNSFSAVQTSAFPVSWTVGLE